MGKLYLSGRRANQGIEKEDESVWRSNEDGWECVPKMLCTLCQVLILNPSCVDLHFDNMD